MLSITLYAAYVAFFVWFSGSMKSLHTVHSRVGLAFTGLVEIIVSTITSLSVCALAGFKITMVPWCVVLDTLMRRLLTYSTQGTVSHCHSFCRC
jgi:hypothetical protein